LNYGITVGLKILMKLVNAVRGKKIKTSMKKIAFLQAGAFIQKLARPKLG
jgi:hypothetical protein